MGNSLASREDGLESLITSARDAAQNLDKTLTTTNGTIERLDQNLVRELPGILDKLDKTLAKLDSAAGNADAILGENRAAISSLSLIHIFTVGAFDLGIPPQMYIARMHDTIEVTHFLVGMSKAPIFALVIGLIGCLQGLQVEGTAQSVGERTTSSVVQTISLVIICLLYTSRCV